MSYLKNELKLLGVHLSIVVAEFIFIALEGWALGRILLGIGLFICHICFYYSTAHNIATADLKRNSKVTPYKMKGLVLGIIHIALLGALMAIFHFIGEKYFQTKLVTSMFFGLLSMPFRIFDMTAYSLVWSSYPLMLSVPVLTWLGYYLGNKKISIAEKYIVPFIYQKEE